MEKFNFEGNVLQRVKDIIGKGARKEQLNWIFIKACDVGSLEVVQFLLDNDKVDPSYNENMALKAASYYKHMDVVKVLLQSPKLKIDFNDIMIALDWYR